MKKYAYILLMSLACMVALNSCLGNGGETIPLEFETPKGDISPVDGIPNDALASANPEVNATVAMPDFGYAVVSGTKNVKIAELYIPGIKYPDSEQWLYLVGTGGAYAIPQNVWVSIDGEPKGCLALNNSKNEVSRQIDVDFVFLVNNSNNMAEAGDIICRDLAVWSDMLSKNNQSVLYGCVGYGGGENVKGVDGASNLSTSAELLQYLSREGCTGVARTKGFNGADANEAIAVARYQNCSQECGVEALKFADEAFTFRKGACRMYFNVTDEGNQPGGNPQWSVETVASQNGWEAGRGEIHTLYSGYDFNNQQYVNEQPGLLSSYTGGYYTHCDKQLSGIELMNLPMTGALQNFAVLRFANVEKYMDGKFHTVVLTISSMDKLVQASKAFSVKFGEKTE